MEAKRLFAAAAVGDVLRADPWNTVRWCQSLAVVLYGRLAVICVGGWQ